MHLDSKHALDQTMTTALDALLDATHALGTTMEYREARWQAEILLAHALGVSHTQALARLDEEIAPEIAARYAASVARRAKHEPLAYILGHREFYRLDFLVDRRVLIPRFETETLVELALQAARKITAPVIVDVGTGSGALALTLAYHLPDARVISLDISRDALEVARLNAARLNLASRVEFLESDLLTRFTGAFNVLVANLPYIPQARWDALPREVRAFEPRIALDGGADGLEVFCRLLTQLETRAARNALAFLEISEEQGQSALQAVWRLLPRCVATVHHDLEGLDRVVEIQIPNSEF